MSFEHIRQTRPSAVDLLSLMSFFDRQGIPEDVLRSRGKQKENDSNEQGAEPPDADTAGEDDASQSSVSDDELVDDTFEDGIVALRNFCFISDETGGATFEVHARG